MISNNIFMLWWQGWDNCPELVKQVYNSWKYHNPTWEIICLSESNISDYLEIEYLFDENITVQSKSDIIRVHILHQYGGIWADSTLVCLQSLNNWIDDKISLNGFWMYHGNGNRLNPINGKYNGACSWFLVSEKHSYMITKWKEKIDIFWNNKYNIKTYSYFWLDQLFNSIYCENDVFKKQWDSLPYIFCDDIGQSHYLAITGQCVNTKEYKKNIKNKPPYVMKMQSSWKNVFEEVEANNSFSSFKTTNGYYTLMLGQNLDVEE